MKKLPLLIVSLLFYCAPALAQVKNMPEFKFFRMSNGTQYTDKDIPSGKKTLIVFFDTECPHCMQAMSAYNNQVGDLGKINILLVTKDRKELVMPFLENFGDKISKLKNVTLLQDLQNQFISRFYPRKYPSMFLFSATRSLLMYSDEEKDIPQFLSLIKS